MKMGLRTKLLLILGLGIITVALMVWSAWAFGFVNGRETGLAFCVEQSELVADQGWRING